MKVYQVFILLFAGFIATLLLPESAGVWILGVVFVVLVAAMHRAERRERVEK
jgi:hypothetical protein